MLYISDVLRFEETFDARDDHDPAPDSRCNYCGTEWAAGRYPGEPDVPECPLCCDSGEVIAL